MIPIVIGALVTIPRALHGGEPENTVSNNNSLIDLESRTPNYCMNTKEDTGAGLEDSERENAFAAGATLRTSLKKKLTALPRVRPPSWTLLGGEGTEG